MVKVDFILCNKINTSEKIVAEILAVIIVDVFVFLGFDTEDVFTDTATAIDAVVKDQFEVIEFLEFLVVILEFRSAVEGSGKDGVDAYP